MLARDGQRCRLCGAPATEVDHVVAGDDHSLANLRALCRRCHARKSATEGARAAAQARAVRRARYERAPEPHPGLVR